MGSPIVSYQTAAVGVDLVDSPIHTPDGGLLEAQNVEIVRVQGLGGIGSRGSLTPLNTVALNGPVLALAAIPLPSAADDATIDVMYRLTPTGLDSSPVPPDDPDWKPLLPWPAGPPEDPDLYIPAFPDFAPWSFPWVILPGVPPLPPAVVVPGRYDSDAGTTALLKITPNTRSVAKVADIPGRVVDLATDGTNVYAAVNLQNTYTYEDASPGYSSNAPSPLFTSRVIKLDDGFSQTQVGHDLTNDTQTGDADGLLIANQATGAISTLTYGADARLYVVVGGGRATFLAPNANSILWNLLTEPGPIYDPNYLGATDPPDGTPPVNPYLDSQPSALFAGPGVSGMFSIDPTSDSAWTNSGAVVSTGGTQTPAAGPEPAWDAESSADGDTVYFAGVMVSTAQGPPEIHALPNYSNLDDDSDPGTWPATGGTRKATAYPGANAGSCSLFRVDVDPAEPTDCSASVTLVVDGDSNAGVAWFGPGVFFNGSFFVPYISADAVGDDASVAVLYRLDADDVTSPAPGWTVDLDIVGTYGAATPGRMYLAGSGADQKLFLPMTASGNNGYLLSRDQSGTWAVEETGLDLLGAGFPLTVPA